MKNIQIREFTDKDILPVYKDVVTYPCKTEADGEPTGVAQCEAHEAEFFGVYVIQMDGLKYWVADMETAEQGERLAELLKQCVSYPVVLSANTTHTLHETIAFASELAFNTQPDSNTGVTNFDKLCFLFPDGTHGFIERLNEVIAWAKEFEGLNLGREWDGEWHDELTAFTTEKLDAELPALLAEIQSKASKSGIPPMPSKTKDIDGIDVEIELTDPNYTDDNNYLADFYMDSNSPVSDFSISGTVINNPINGRTEIEFNETEDEDTLLAYFDEDFIDDLKEKIVAFYWELKNASK